VDGAPTEGEEKGSKAKEDWRKRKDQKDFRD